MAENEDKKNDGEKGEIVETTGRVRLNPVPLRFGGAKNAEKDEKNLPARARPKTEREKRLEDPRRIIAEGMIVVGLFFGLFGIWAFFGTIEGAIIAPGTIKIESERKIVQHLEGGIVDEILVKEGEEVQAGQPLVLLQSVATDANAEATRKRLVAQEAQRARALAEKDRAEKITWSEELKMLAKDAGALDTLENEEKIFATRRESLATQVSLLKTQIAQLKSQIAGSQDQLVAERKIIAALNEELGAKRKLHEQRYLDKAQILNLERELATHQGSRGRLTQAVAELKQRGAELNLRVVELETRFVEEATRNLGQAENDLFQTREQLRPLEDASKRLRVTAPVAGKVVDLKIHSPGGVVRPGEVLMDIVPHGNPLIVETQVPVNKITEVYMGQPAQVMLDAFDTRVIPHMPGKVTYISADRLERQGGPPYYLCYVQVDPDSLKEANLYMFPGMPATVFLTTQERTVVYYMFEPMIKSWDRSLRD